LFGDGFLPNGFYRNRDFYAPFVEANGKNFLYDLIYDPQSSGGLLIALSENSTYRFKKAAAQVSLDYWVIGRFLQKPKGKIIVK